MLYTEIFTQKIDMIICRGPSISAPFVSKITEKRTIVNLGQAHTSISANFPQNTAVFEVLVELYKNRTI